MRTLPAKMVYVLSPLVPLFSRRVWSHVQVDGTRVPLAKASDTDEVGARSRALLPSGQPFPFSRVHCWHSSIEEGIELAKRWANRRISAL
jgi:hypothetical protein